MVIKIDERATLLTVLKDRNVVLQRTVSYGADAAIDVIMNTKLQEETFGYSEAIDMLREEVYIRRTFDESVVDDEEVRNNDESYRKIRIDVTSALEIMINSIARVIDYYNSKSGDDPIKKLILTGLGGNFNGLSKLMANELGMNLMVLKKAEGVNLDKAQKNDHVSLGEYLACIGAAIDPLDFIPDERKSKKQRAAISGKKNLDMSVDAGRLSILMLAGGLIIAAVLAVISVAGFITVSAQNQVLQNKVTELEPVEQVYNQYVSVNAIYQQVVTMYKTTQSPNEKLLEFMNELESKMPSSTNITTFSSTSERVTIGIRVNTKEEAVSAIYTLRKFASISAHAISSTNSTALNIVNNTRRV
jgi:type IV pilus assembly protein PilM